MARRKQKLQPQPGWAIYLRTSDEEAQNPESSQARQRYLIDRAVLERSELPVIEVYKDVITGKTPHRKDYQRMLEDARFGKFSHVVVERADRFGRNDAVAHSWQSAPVARLSGHDGNRASLRPLRLRPDRFRGQGGYDQYGLPLRHLPAGVRWPGHVLG